MTRRRLHTEAVGGEVRGHAWRVLRMLPLVLLALLLSGCGRFPLWPIDPVSPTATHMIEVWTIVSYIAIGISVFVSGLMFYALLRFGGKRGPIGDDEPVQVHGNTRLEITWTLIPTLIVILLLGVAMSALQANTLPAAVASKSTFKVNVAGFRWAWAYTFPQLPGLNVGAPGRTIPNHLSDLHLPTGRLIEVDVTARDVVHDWWVPALDGHLDAYPGHHVLSWYRLQRPGIYYAQCSKFCGQLHWTMHNDIVVDTPTDFARWAIANGAKRSDVQTLLGLTSAQTAALGPRTPARVAAVTTEPRADAGPRVLASMAAKHE